MSASSLHSQLKTSNIFLENEVYEKVGSWSFLTSHARVLLCIAHDPGVRLRDIAASLDITERSACGIVTDLTAVGYTHQSSTPPPTPAIGEVLALPAGTSARLQVTRTGPA